MLKGIFMNNLLFSVANLSDALVNTLSGVFGNWYVVLFNVFGVLAMIFKICEYQLKTRDKIIIFATSAACCWFTYFMLQGDFASGISNLILIIEGFVFYQRGKHKWADSIVWLFVFLGAQATFGIFTFKTALDLFPILAGAFCTVAYFVIKENRYRVIVIFAMMMWLSNSITKGYVLAIVNDSCCVISAIIGLIRFNITGKNKNLATEKQEEVNANDELTNQND